MSLIFYLIPILTDFRPRFNKQNLCCAKRASLFSPKPAQKHARMKTFEKKEHSGYN